MPKNNFQRDLEFGKIGENDFITNQYNKILIKKYPYFYDTRDIPKFRNVDVDFVISKVPLDLSTEEKIQSLIDNTKHFEQGLRNANYLFVEIKTDRMAYKTNNMVYKITAKDGAGSTARSKCDFLYYYVVDKNDKIWKGYCYSMFKLRRFIGENCEQINHTPNMRLKYWVNKNNKFDSRCLILLINYKWLYYNKIFKEITTKSQ